MRVQLKRAMNPSPDILLDGVVSLAKQAGYAILEVYGRSDHGVTQKADHSPLTEADLASHALISAGLRQLTPDIPVLSEESAEIPADERRAWSRFWLVDPLDGTKEFISRNGEFTVNIALIDGHHPALGVVHVPALGVCYFATPERGAWRQRASDAPEAIRVTRPAAQPLRVVGSRSHPGPDLAALTRKLGSHTLVAVGSALKFCLVAEGSADFYPRLGPTWWWDTAAAQCVAECAGAGVVDTSGRRLAYNQGDNLRNPHFLVYGDTDRDWLAVLPRV